MMTDLEIKSVIGGLDEISGMSCQQMIRGDNDVLIRKTASDALSVICELKAENERLKVEKVKEEIKVGDEVASVNPATGELNLWNTFIVTEIGEDFIGGINSKGETHFHDEPGIFSIWAKTGKHIDILRAFEPVETASPKEGEQE